MRPPADVETALERAPRPWPTPLLLVVTLLLSAAAAGGGTLPGDVAVARWLQRAPDPPAAAAARFGDWVGSTPALAGIAVACALLLLLAGHSAPAALLLAAVLLRALNPLLKAILDSSRPTADLIRVTEEATGTGFPSGHAMGVVLLFGALAYLAGRLVGGRRPRRLVQAAALLVLLVTGFGRVYTGAHWPSDVLGGVLWGALLLVAIVRGGRTVRRPAA